MAQFKVGDVVKLKDIPANLHYGMGEKVFRVSEIVGSYLAINGGDPVWYEGRFEAVEKQDELPEAPVTINVKTVIDLLEDYEMEKEDIINYLNGYIDGAHGGRQ